jgi:uncharacterized protein
MPEHVTIQTPAGVVVCARCELAHTPARRLRGLLGRRSLAPGAGLLLHPASSIHTCFMRFAIDAVFLDGNGRVLRVAAELPPWRFASQRGACSVLELPAGTYEKLGAAQPP